MKTIKNENYVGKNKLFVESWLPEIKTEKMPILFVGGAFDGSWIFNRHAGFLSENGYPIYAMNLRGQYKSKFRGIEALSYEDYLKDISDTAEDLNLKNFILAGYSMGGILAQKFAEKNSDAVAGLMLFDTTYSKEISELFDKPKKKPIHLPPLMSFIPPKAIVEEMFDETITDEKYNSVIELFRNTYLSSKAYYKLEVEKISIDFARIKCPVLIISIGKDSPASEQMHKLLKSSVLYLEGYSHGSILASSFFKPVAEKILYWLDSGLKTGEKIYYNWHRDLISNERYRTNLWYYSGWENPAIQIQNRNGLALAEIAFKKVGDGRKAGEFLFHAEFNLKKNNTFLIKNGDLTDTPGYGGLYAPLEKNLYLADGVFYFHPFGMQKNPVYITEIIKCESLNQIFTVHIRLPRNYDEKITYPASILNDGQNQYKGYGAHGGWHTDAILEDLSRRGRCRDLILIAVESPSRRNETYLAPPIGKANLYVNFLCDVLLPKLREKFNITKDPKEISIIGASYGANNSIYAGILRPDVFGLVGSLSFAYLPKCPIRSAMRELQSLPFHKLYVDCGTKWSHDQPHRDDNTSSTKDLINIAKKKGMVENENLLGLIFAGHYHNEVFWRKRIGGCLEFLFSSK